MDPSPMLNNGSQNATTVTPELDAGHFLSSMALFLMAVLPIYFGSKRSSKKNEKQESDDVVSTKEAALFPVIASVALFGVFLVFKFLPPTYINFIVKLHFSIVGIGSMTRLFAPMFYGLLPNSLSNHCYKLEFSSSLEVKSDTEITEWKPLEKHSLEIQTKDFIGAFLAIAIGVCYFCTGHWVANNLIALTLAVLAIEFIKLNKFANGFVLLGGLFLYDIFWVFGTPVMVSVAKNLEAPIKVTFPRDFLTRGIFGNQLALLGLGDIVIPGIFIAMLHRFDLHLARRSNSYFISGYVAYIVGILLTFIVMYAFKHPQPALLYLVPTCLGFPLLMAAIRGDIPAMLEYEDAPEQSEEKADSSSTTVEPVSKESKKIQ